MNSWPQRLWKICNEAQMATGNALDDAPARNEGGADEHMGP